MNSDIKTAIGENLFSSTDIFKLIQLIPELYNHTNNILSYSINGSIIEEFSYESYSHGLPKIITYNNSDDTGVLIEYIETIN